MSEHDELPPPLSPEVSAFLSEHAGTGEPAPEGLVRLRARVEERVLARRVAIAPAPPPVRTRRWLRSEVMAAAAVLAVIVGGQAAYLLLRHDAPPVPVVTVLEQPLPQTPVVRQVLEQYRAGKLTEALRLAKAQCSPETCGALQASLDKAADMTARLEELTSAELQELTALDLALGEQTLTPVGQLAEKKRLKLPPNPVTKAKADQLASKGLGLRRARNYEGAREVFQQCLVLEPRHADCTMQLAAVHAALATLNRDPAELERARVLYERYLVLAPPDDPSVARVRAILNADPGDVTPPSQPEPPRDSPSVMANELYLRGYQLKESNPEGARRAFRDALEVAPPGSDVAQKARMRLQELGSEPQGAMPNSDGGELRLFVGERHRLALPVDVQRVAVGNEHLVDVTVASPRALQLRGKRPGQTTMLVWYASGQRQSYLLIIERP